VQRLRNASKNCGGWVSFHTRFKFKFGKSQSDDRS
jgi:hypothetical protein